VPSRLTVAFWMQTTGAMLLTVRRSSLACTWMLAQGRRGAHGLLYFTAVRGDQCEHEVSSTIGRSDGSLTGYKNTRSCKLGVSLSLMGQSRSPPTGRSCCPRV
jgi:hypothetical protein